MFSGLGVTDLYLDGNHITSVPASVFTGLAKIVRLSLASNAITARMLLCASALSSHGCLCMRMDGCREKTETHWMCISLMFVIPIPLSLHAYGWVERGRGMGLSGEWACGSRVAGEPRKHTQGALRMPFLLLCARALTENPRSRKAAHRF